MNFLILILIIIFIFVFRERFTFPFLVHKKEIQENGMDEINYKMYYKPKIYITTKKEKFFYNVLLEIANELNYTLFAQVPLYAIITTQEGLDNSTQQKFFNKISSKSIDFVLVDNKCRILLCIELDDRTHRYKNRIERDKFINKLFSDLGIGILRYPTYNTYYKETLKKKILENIKNEETAT